MKSSLMYLVILFAGLSFAQVPEWENSVTLPFDLEQVSMASDGYGQHVVGVQNGEVKYYLVGSDGAVIRSATIASGTVPSVTSYGGAQRVVSYAAQNQDLELYESEDAGQPWQLLRTFPISQFSPARVTHSYTNSQGTHIVWDNAEGYGEVYYVRYFLGDFRNFKNITDESDVEWGSIPKVVATNDQALVVFASRFFSLPCDLTPAYERKLIFNTGAWSSPMSVDVLEPKVLNLEIHTDMRSYHLLANSYSADCPLEPGYLVGTHRPIDGSQWSEAEVLGYQQKFSAILPFASGMSSDGEELHVAYSLYVLDCPNTKYVLHRVFANGVWSDPFEITPYPPCELPRHFAEPWALSSNQFGAFVLYKEWFYNNDLHMRRKVRSIRESISQNSYLSGNNWIEGTDASVPSGVTVTAISGSETRLIGRLFHETNAQFDMQINAKVIVEPSGTLQLDDNVALAVVSESVLEADTGAQLLFGANASLAIGGVLLGNGTAANPVTFTTDGSTWSGITVNNCNPSSVSLLNHTRIEHAATAVRIGTNTTVDIKNSVIDNADIGIEFASSAQQCPVAPPHVEVQGNTLSNIRTSGIVVNDYSNLTIEGNTIDGTCTVCQEDRYGIFCNNASPTILDNQIHGFNFGIATVSNSSPILQRKDAGGHNVVSNNDNGVLSDGSDAILGLITDDNPEGGQNSFVNPYGAEAVVTNSSYVMAINNWWGTPEDPSGRFYVNNSTFKYEPWLESDSNERNAPILVKGNNKLSSEEPNDPNGMGNSITRAEILRVLALRNRQQYAEALTVLQSLIPQRDLPAWLRRWAVRQTVAIAQHMQESDLSTYLLGALAQNPELSRDIKCALPNAYLHEQRRSDAMDRFVANIREFPNSPLERTALYEQFLDALYVDGSLAEANSILTAMIQRYPDNPETGIAQSQFANFRTSANRPSVPKVGGSVAANATSEIIPTEFHLEQNYPNPFNPTTIIKYDLPVDAQVTLKVYDILGKQVLTLVNEQNTAGSHSVVVDASHLSSGVYFYRIAAGAFQKRRNLSC